MGKFTVLNHPLIQHKLTIIRKKDTGTNEFRQIVGEIGGLMVYEMTRDLPLKNVEIETPIGKSTQKELAGKKLVIVPILRAGLGMVDGVLQMIPSAKVGHIGMYRDEETLKPHEYFFKMPPDIEERECIIVAVQEANPDVDIYAAAEDEKLMDNGYIYPGLGDAGDRLFGTK